MQVDADWIFRILLLFLQRIKDFRSPFGPEHGLDDLGARLIVPHPLLLLGGVDDAQAGSDLAANVFEFLDHASQTRLGRDVFVWIVLVTH